MSGVTKIHAREILDSRGNPTVEVDLVTPKGIIQISISVFNFDLRQVYLHILNTSCQFFNSYS